MTSGQPNTNRREVGLIVAESGQNQTNKGYRGAVLTGPLTFKPATQGAARGWRSPAAPCYRTPGHDCKRGKIVEDPVFYACAPPSIGGDRWPR